MRILVVHNDYGVYSGEEAVVDRLVENWRQRGHEVRELRLSSQGSRDKFTGKLRGFLAGIYSIRGRRLMRRALHEFNPDVVNVHNLYPFISPAVLPLCKRNGARVVMTVHNYRLICPTGLFLRNGKPCENCLVNGNEWDCIKYNCEQSRSRSLGYALRGAAARLTKSYKNCVDCFCCLTEFQKEKLIAAGFDEKKIAVIPNYVSISDNAVQTRESRVSGLSRASSDPSGFVGYVGRLSHEKGYDLLLEVASRHPEIPFRMAGTPRDNTILDVPSNVTLCGQIDKQQLAEFYHSARFVVIPSRCYEGFPTVLLESACFETPCVAPAHGPFPDLLTDSNGNMCGMLFKPLDVDDLEKTVVELWNNRDRYKTLGCNARKNIETRFTEDAVMNEWEKVL